MWVAILCERFHALPSAIMGEDAAIIERVVAIQGELERLRQQARPKGKRGKSR